MFQKKKIRVAINGFGRIGRAFLKVARERDEIEVVAVNDLGDIKNMAYLLKHDTVYRTSPFDVQAVEGSDPYLLVDGEKIMFLSQRDPAQLPWKKMSIDVVVESTGLFTSYDKAKVHLDAGARRVVISAPAKGGQGESMTPGVSGATILMGVNEDKFKTCQITSNASCTTNAGSPIITILDEAIGIEKAVLNTVHGYTASQSIVDGPAKKDWREGRAAAMNIVPTSTGAAIATTKALTQLEGKFDGISIRVPVVAGSIVDITFIAKRPTTADEVNIILKKASGEARWRDIFATTDEELVSSDILGESHASIADLKMTRVVDGTLVKVLGWYDNEMGYTHTLVSHVIKAGQA
ncbi:MAG: type I glyceraldehyde-3-phosphate dehydrogenase [Patescibacteria group bacterium]|nr:type I glyceraldehyde-3-phosphate dehydrogenase [Patescibacteria group bacterium]MDE2116461.1 type I glyceraldehyde-3-phosphate dehydrogenase [Patescibacteria group bacterium]